MVAGDNYVLSACYQSSTGQFTDAIGEGFTQPAYNYVKQIYYIDEFHGGTCSAP